MKRIRLGRESREKRAISLIVSAMLALSVALLQQTAARADQPEMAAVPQMEGPSKTTLQGGLSHAEELPGLDDSLQEGKVFSDDLLMKPDTKITKEWFLVPPWYAGVRHCEKATILSRYDFATGITTQPMFNQMNRQDSTSGYQKDRLGGIWDFKHVPTIQHVESDLVNAVLYVKAIKPLMGSADRLMIKYEEVSISLSKRTNKIVSIVQQEQINTITSPSPDTLRIDVSVRSFDSDGKPQRQEESVIIANIVKPFEQIDTYQGENLRPSFKDYLVSHHLENLVPDDLK
jgi:hypothetical protein